MRPVGVRADKERRNKGIEPNLMLITCIDDGHLANNRGI